MTKKDKRDFTVEFRQQAVEMAIKSDKPTAHTARELGISPSTLYAWIDKLKSEDSQPSEAHNNVLLDEVKRLKRELAEVKEQRDILKKATAYFEKESR